MSELMDRIGKTWWFTKLDLKNGFNLVHITSGHEWKTAFKTYYRAYEYMVIPQELTNAPSIFQCFMNHVL